MCKKELSIYIKQFIILIIIYITCLLPIIYNNPINATLNCNESYVCKVEMRYIFNLMQSGEFSVNENTKLRFVRPLIVVNNNYTPGFVNIYDDIDSVNYDPFGTENFYDRMNNYTMKDDIDRFSDYIKNPQIGFSMKKSYNNLKAYLLCGIVTILFALLALLKRPIEPFAKIIDFLIPNYFKKLINKAESDMVEQALPK